jgi:hypothetical protein
MPINTDLNVTPYYDDYDEDKKFHKVLFRPSVPIQARELTQLQTILQNQVERFGEHMFKDGTIVKGATFTDQKINFAKLNDANTSLNQLVMSEFDSTHVVTSSNLIAQVFERKSGFESTNPDLNTIFFSYVNSGNNSGTEELAFSSGQTLDVYAQNTSIAAVAVTSSTGASYSNADTITFSSTFGTNASANLTTNSTGGIIGTSFNNTSSQGVSFKITDLPSVANIVTSTGSNANLELFAVTLTKKNIVTIANTSFNDITGNTDFLTLGTSKYFKVSDGIIFQKGNFSQVSEQAIIISDYTSTPNAIAVGFQTIETIANNVTDPSLNDNASGFQNENAPGAYRLKLTPTLVVNTVTNAEATNNFFIVAKYESGEIVTTSGDTLYNKLGDRFAKRTREESGNYVKKQFIVKTEALSGNTTHLNLTIDPGIAYVSGYRVETVGTSRLPIPKAETTQNVSSAIIASNYGAYQLVDESIGHFAFNFGAEVKLLDTAANRLSSSLGTHVPTVPATSNTTVITGANPAFSGNIMGTAKIRSVTYEANVPGDPLGKYRLYLFDINMNQGMRYKDVRSIWYNAEGLADVVLDDNAEASLKETNFRTLVTPTGRDGIKTTSINGTSNNQYIYRTAKTDGALATNGSVTFSVSGTESFPYTASAFLNDTQEKDWIVVSNNSTAQTVSLTGTVAVSSGAGNVTGTSTLFTTEYKAGDFITVQSANTHRITSVVSNTLMVTANNFGAGVSGKTHARYFPVDVAINMEGSTSNVFVGTNSNTVTINATRGKALHGSQTLPLHVYHNVKKTSAPQVDKTLATSFVKIVCSNNAGGITGPWCLGLTDVLDVQNVISSNQAYWDGSTDANTTHVERKANFRLDTGQKDGFYSLGKLYKNQSNSIAHVANDFFTVKVRHFKKDTSGGGKGFFNVDSYPVDDTTANGSNEYIKTEQIPIFVSEVTGQEIDLRNAIDFRPVAANTATQAVAVGDATINPNVAVVFAASEQSIAAPNENFQYDYQYYIPRIDKAYINAQGALETIQGAPGIRPLAPKDMDDAITLGTIRVPVYPSLSTKEARIAKRLDYKVTNKSSQNRGYSMEDIGQIDQRVNRLEYYSSLNMLEKQTKDLTIPAESNNAIDRFKQGFLVDNFVDLSIADTTDEDWNAGRNKTEQTIIPKFKQNGLNLSVAGHSNTQLTGETLTHPYTAQAFMGQRFATVNRSATQGNWQFNGNIQLFPNYDGWTDTRFSPDNVMEINMDVSDQFNSLIENINQIESLTETDREVLRSSTVSTQTGSNGSGSWGINDTTTTELETRNLFNGTESSSRTRVGEFVTDIRMSPFIREQMVHFHAWGLRPNSRHYVYFDGTDVNANTRPALSTNATTHSKASIYAAGAYGGNLVTGADGEMFGILHIPANEFAVGERHLVIADNATYDDVAENSISTADEAFNAYNFGIDKGVLDQTTRKTTFGRNTVQNVTVRTEASRWFRPRPPPPPRPRQRAFGSGGAGGGAGADPMAQTFRITGPDLGDIPGLQITSMDLYFATKDPTLGVTIEIRKVANGFPSDEIMPFSRKHMKSSQISTSVDGSVATAIVFDGPVFLSTTEEYCFVILPDGNSPDYRVWVSKTGGVDVASGQPVVVDQFVGSMFLSTNNSAWKPFIDEDVKFTLYRAGFTTDSSNNGVVTFFNKANEYLSLSTINGNFKQGEIVFQVNASAQTTGTATMSTSNTIVTGTGTAFNTEYAAGDFLTFSNTTAQDTVEIDSVTNSTQIILKGYPLISNTTGIAVTNTPTGIVYFYDSANKDLHIEDSTASSSSFKFAAAASIVGAESGANATIVTVDDKAVSYLEPVLYKANPSLTDVQMFIHANTASGDTGNTQIRTNDRTYFKDKAVIKSKSNDLTGNFKTYFKMNTSTTRMSPMIDSQSIGFNMYENVINNDITNEHITGQGNALCSYVSKAVTLDDGLDAEDLRVYLTAYKPGRDNCQVKVFGKILSEEDTDTFYDRHWTELDLIGEDHFSNDDNRLDYREYQYQMPQTPASVFVEKAKTFGNTTITTASNQASTLSAGTLVKITNTDPLTDYQIATVKSASTTTIILDEAIQFANNVGADVSTVTLPQTAFKDPQNDTVATYFNSTGSKFSTYKVFAVKIVLLSDSTATTPAIKDFRAIALSV